MSTETGETILKLQKRGDYNISTFAFDGQNIAYTDAKETQVFKFDTEELKLTKLTKKICAILGIKSLPPAQALFFRKSESGDSTSLIMITTSLEIVEIDLSSQKGTQLFNKSAFETDFAQMSTTDSIIRCAHFNEVSGELFLAFASSKHFYQLDLA